MIYIGFSTTTHKIIAKFICHKYKHCAPIIFTNNTYKIFQFTKYNDIKTIQIKHRDIKILQYNGWKFIKYDKNKIPKNISNFHALTCVQFTKQFCGIKKITIQTPDGLLKYLGKK